MAVPTITSLTPSSGPACGGNYIRIVGTNFKTPTVIVAIPVVEDIPTVKVTFGGYQCPKVKVLSSTVLEVLPPWDRREPRSGSPPELKDALGAVDVRVANLQSSGAEVPGEAVTRAGGYTYQRWMLGPPAKVGAILGVLEAFLERMRREVCKNVDVTRSAAYAEGTAVEVDPAVLPSVGVVVRVQDDREVSYLDQGRHYYPDPAGGGRHLQYEGLRTYILDLDLILAGHGLGEALTLCERVQDSFAIAPILYGPANTTVFPDRTYEEYPLEIREQPSQMAGEGTWNLVSFSMRVQILGIRAMPDKEREKIWSIDKFKVCIRENGYAEQVVQ